MAYHSAISLLISLSGPPVALAVPYVCVQMFPFYKNHSEALRTVMTEIKEGDRRQDVQQMAQVRLLQRGFGGLLAQ